MFVLNSVLALGISGVGLAWDKKDTLNKNAIIKIFIFVSIDKDFKMKFFTVEEKRQWGLLWLF